MNCAHMWRLSRRIYRTRQTPCLSCLVSSSLFRKGVYYFVWMLKPSIPVCRERTRKPSYSHRWHSGDDGRSARPQHVYIWRCPLRQDKKTPIGSHLGINYASTYMGSWEKELLERSTKQPLTYFRFVDDVWGLWTHGLDALQDFHQ